MNQKQAKALAKRIKQETNLEVEIRVNFAGFYYVIVHDIHHLYFMNPEEWNFYRSREHVSR